MNRLGDAVSLYLRQHACDPVHWFPWGEDAFNRAKLEQKPVLVSIGYSACHWCHVMAHESFQDSEIADFLNANYICVKVDREEHPDVDEAFMTAVQISRGRGGWPITAFVTPDKKPFLAETYIPKEAQAGHIGFLDVLRQIANGWRLSRNDFEQAANEFAQALAQTGEQRIPAAEAPASLDSVMTVLGALAKDFDEDFGGFGTAPKFPAHSAISFLLLCASALAPDPEMEDVASAAASMAVEALATMALGGIHDHVNGGFHRYSTDRQWHLPHFEKMLVDNALALSNYSTLKTVFGGAAESPVFASASSGIVRWMLGPMRNPDGTFATSMDADTDGEEGLSYLWSLQEIQDLLGDRAPAFSQAFGLQHEGNYLDEATGQLTGVNVLHRNPEVEGEFAAELGVLERSGRTLPAVERSATPCLNGLAIRALVQAGEIEAARECAAIWWRTFEAGNSLPHMLLDGIPRGHGYLEDFAALALGCLALSQAENNMMWFQRATDLIVMAEDLFADEVHGGAFHTSSRHDRLFARTKPVTDNPCPSGNALLISAQMLCGRFAQAERGLRALGGWVDNFPTATTALAEAQLWWMIFSPEPDITEELVENVAPPPAVEAFLAANDLVADADGFATGEILVSIPDGWHLNSHAPPARWLVPTVLSFDGLSAEAVYPPAKDDRLEGNVTIGFRVQPGAEEVEGEVSLTYQACTETECLEPVTKRFAVRVRRG